MKDRHGTTSENDIINMKKHNDRGRTIMIDKHRGVRRRTSETMRQKETTESMKPGSRSLFKAINCLLEFTNKVRKVRVNEA